MLLFPVLQGYSMRLNRLCGAPQIGHLAGASPAKAVCRFSCVLLIPVSFLLILSIGMTFWHITTSQSLNQVRFQPRLFQANGQILRLVSTL